MPKPSTSPSGSGGGFWDTIKNIFGAIGSFLSSLFSAEQEVVGNVQHLIQSLQDARDKIGAEVEEIKNFKFDPKWKTRVINVPRAFKAFQQLKGEIFDDFRERLGKLQTPFDTFKGIFDTTSDADAGDKIAGLNKAAVKVHQLAVLIQQLDQAMDEIVNFIDFFSRLRDEAEHLDDLFLQQGNSRQRLTDEEFATHSPRQRIGKLHSA